jgi:hypothetical protein
VKTTLDTRARREIRDAGALKGASKSAAAKGNSLIFPRHLPSTGHSIENGTFKS